ncbi:MAG: GGDEF domain-containing protein, partial [Clostridiales bacterium]|nr:GGDEF domain-containing protein [Clostridiales bacterium]
IRRILAIAIKQKDDELNVVVLMNKAEDYNQDNITQTSILMTGFWTILDRGEQVEQIKYLSFHDSLTGFYNRRFFEEEISRLDTKRNYPLSIVFADVNGLKNTNDNYGHKEGDKLLKEAAKIIKSEFRSDDIIARIGGDEFIALLPKTKIEDSERIVDRIKKKCSESYIDSIEISIAFGVDAKIESEQNINGIIKNAEDKMYCNKKKAKAAM